MRCFRRSDPGSPAAHRDSSRPVWTYGSLTAGVLIIAGTATIVAGTAIAPAGGIGLILLVHQDGLSLNPLALSPVLAITGLVPRHLPHRRRAQEPRTPIATSVERNLAKDRHVQSGTSPSRAVWIRGQSQRSHSSSCARPLRALCGLRVKIC